MKYDQLHIGQRLYNRGDMANPDHWGTITKMTPAGRFSDDIQITPDEDSPNNLPYSVSACMISDVDNGNGLTRIVTKEAREAYINQYLKQMQEVA
jgi:hypothetical protein